jgi:hypothetical protein
MPNNNHLAALLGGVKFWNEWRQNNPEVLPDLRFAEIPRMDLNGANLRRVNLNGSNLNGVSLIGADLTQASLCGVNLVDANFSKAYLNRTNFSNSNLSNITCTSTAFSGTNLHRAILDNADFSDAYMTEAIFSENDLSTIKGLLSIRHRGPSTISISTLYKSRGNIPSDFLRDCGVPDDFIRFIPAFAGDQQAIQFYSCFISYSHTDESFAKCLHSRLRDEHIRVWFAPEDIRGGDKIHEQIEHAIKIHDKLLIVLSENSLKSEWVMTEIRKARRAEIRENRRKLFPIRLVNYEALQSWECFDSDSGKDLAVEVREYYIPDFSNWQNKDFFEAEFSRLVRDMKSEESSKRA